MSNPTIRAVIWAAVSTKAQTKENDKDSLEHQEMDALAICKQNGWQVVEVLRIPGHSRRGTDIHTVAREMRESPQKIDAFDRLLDLWSKRGFDILVCRDGDRFARSQSLFARVAETTVFEVGARIYSFADGMVDKSNCRMWIAMCGYRAASHVDALVAGRKVGIGDNVRKGLPSSYAPNMTHIIERDPKNGKAIRMVLDPARTQFWQDVATLILEGVGWYKIEHELYTRFGYVNPNTGRPYSSRTIYQAIYNPATFGHSARYYDNKTFAAWVYDDSEAPPEGVELYRHTIEPVYTGDQASDIKAELRRRESVIKGRASPNQAHPFTGLLLCGYCDRHYTVRTHPERKDIYWRCSSSLNKISQEKCPASTKSINGKAIKEWLTDKFEIYMAGRDPALFAPHAPAPAVDRAAIEAQIAQLAQELNNLITDQKSARTQTARTLYAEQIAESEDRLEILEKRLATLPAQIESTDQAHQREKSLAYIAEAGPEVFWALPANRINQHLHAIFGRTRLVIADGQVIGQKVEQKRNNRRRG